MPNTKIKSAAVDVAGNYGALLAMIEIGLGSFLHAFAVPFGGFFLSLNQGFILGRVVKNFRDRPFVNTLPLTISNITALLKSLSPAGNRLGPMIAISMQGLLFNIGVLIFGANMAGAILGSMLLCLWSSIQIALYFYLIFGKKLIDVLEFHFREIQAILPLSAEDVLWAVALFVLLKLLLGALLGALAFLLPERFFQKYQSRLLLAYRPRPLLDVPTGVRPALRDSLKAFFSPLFVTTYLLMAAFFVLSGSDSQSAAFFLIRPIAASLLLFFALRHLPTQRLIPWLERTRFRHLSRSLIQALALIQRSDGLQPDLTPACGIEKSA